MEVVYDRMTPKPLVQAHLVVNCILAFLAYAIVISRVYLRITSNAGVGYDDIFIMLATPQATGMLIIQGLWTFLGVGYPITEAMANVPLILRLLVAYELIFALTTMTIKLSALFFYLRVFVNPGLQRMTKIMLVFVVLWSVANVLQVFLICRPFRGTYDTSVTAKCGNQIASFIAIGAFNAVTDVIILTLPIHTVWTLKARTGVKVALSCVFLIGLIVTVVSIARIVALTSVDLSSNLTGTMIYASVLSTTEPILGIICISLPMLRPLFKCQCFSRLKTSSASNQKRTSNLRTFGGSGGRHYMLQDSIQLETVYADANAVDYKGEVIAQSNGGGGGDSETGGRASRDNGSETELAPENHGSPSAKGPGITVERKWMISRS